MLKAILNSALTSSPPLVDVWLDFLEPPIIIPSILFHTLALIICWQLKMFVLKEAKTRKKGYQTDDKRS